MLYVYIVMVDGADGTGLTPHRSIQGAEIEVLSRYPSDARMEDGRPFGPDMLEQALEETGMVRITYDAIRSADGTVQEAPVLRVERHMLGI